MSDPKIISPLLDGFTLGAPIAEHHGVKCCPAIKENTNKKFIVKIISVPASQTQFDALMLAGAYKDPADALEYFRGNGEDILKEAELLKMLSKIEGFLPFDGWQMEPITRRRLGYEIYLVGSYKRSLDKYIRKNAFTHLEAVNLGLDLCSALSVCRQSGYLYADLKPSNIYISEKKEYRIGDLGFLSLDTLRYASLPERYYSPFTPPELLDPMATVNLTVDTYAVGMILYQLYNDGQLPFTGVAPLENLSSPCHADYEMAEIIMKAIHPDPEQRWADPKDLGKAIASYMQRNGVNDIPITPFIPLDVKPEDIVVLSETGDSDVPESEETATEPDIAEIPAAEADQQEPSAVETEEHDTSVIETDTSAETEAEDDDSSAPGPFTEISSEEVTETEESIQPESTSEEILPVQDPLFTTPEINEEPPRADISEEVANILCKADEIITHEIPAELAFPSEESQPDPFAFALDDSENIDDNFPEDPLMDNGTESPVPSKPKKTKNYLNPAKKNKVKKFFSGLFTVILIGAASVGGYWYYQNIYLQTIDALSISGTQDEITVLVDTMIEESLLSVHCTDAKGKRYEESVQGGKVVFSGLNPSTTYTIQVDMQGFHKLTGNTKDEFTTEAATHVLSFQAVAGSEDGSVLLNFTVNGDDPDFWNIRYSTEGEEERLETVTGHSAMITGLTVGKVYTFKLDGGKNFDLSGETTTSYLASRLILAEDMTVSSENGSDITVTWKTPGDVVVESWNVRFYDGYGFEEQMTVTENTVLLTGIDSSSKYTVEITAAGMTQPSKLVISSDPIHLSAFHMDESAQTEMKLTWEYSGNVPEGGWLLNYTVDGSGNQVITCEKDVAKIAPLIPGAKYEFVLETADNRTIFNNSTYYQANEAQVFSEFKYVADNVSINLLKTPENSDWSFETVLPDDFTTTFALGDSASMVLDSSTAVYTPSNKVNAMYVFRDSYGNVLPELITEVSYTWKNIWSKGSIQTGEINIPNLPPVPGEYTMELYFNGCFVTEFDITIAE